MAPLKVEAANRAGDRDALEDAIKNFDELELGGTPAATEARDLATRVDFLENGIFLVYEIWSAVQPTHADGS